MYKTYENNPSSSENIKYEEKIIPEEINESLKHKNNKKNSISGNFFRNMEFDDFIILFLIIFLLNEENNDNFLYFILIAILLFT